LSTLEHKKAFHYQLWNHRLISDFDLGELLRPSDFRLAGPLCIHRIEQSQCAPPKSFPIFEDRFPDGTIWFTSWKLDGGYIIRFPELCSFYISPEQMRIDCAPAPGVAESTIAHLILDHAIPRLLSLTPGFLVFHASAIQVEDQVIAILGKSGQGKSTLAGWFASQGFPLLTDDCLVVRWSEVTQQWLAQPSYHSVRLWPDSVDALGIANSDLREFAGYSEKKRTGREVDFRFASAGAPLAACFVLPDPATPTPAHSGPPKLLPLSVNEAFPKLAGAVFRIDPADPEINRREFGVLTSLTSTVRFWSLHYEREYHWLPAVQKVIIKAVRDENRPQKDLP
jgi:hypothetical protein